MATNTYVALASVTGDGSTSSIEFENIPQGHTDLVLRVQAKSTTGAQAWDIAYVQVGNGSVDIGSNYSWTRIRGDGSSATSGRATNQVSWSLPASGTDDVGSSVGILQIQNYSNTTTFKTSLGRQSATDVVAYANLWRSTSAITNLKVYSYTGSAWTSTSTFSLYGIASTNAQNTMATGGILSEDDTYWYHTFLGTGSFTPSTTLTCDYLVVAGGAGGNSSSGGGGGAGGYRTSGGTSGANTSAESALSLTGGTSYTVTVGAGGANTGSTSSNGSNSTLHTVTSIGGGKGANRSASQLSSVGGSGGGGASSGNAAYRVSAAGTAAQGLSGGLVESDGANNYTGGGGGGASSTGNTANGGGQGGNGLNSVASWATITGTGVSGYYAGGGGGGTNGSSPAGGNGGGGRGGTDPTSTNVFSGTSGVANTGGGGGSSGGTPAGNGGSGVVIIRYLKA